MSYPVDKEPNVTLRSKSDDLEVLYKIYQNKIDGV